MTDIKTITEYLDNDVLDYAKYVVENRAIPSVIDGLKPTQRKIIHIANKTWKTGKEKPMKVFQLTGKISAESYYHHGDGSMNNAIINMVQEFKNNMPLLQRKGQFGTRRSPSAGAPRYIGTCLHRNFRTLYKDFELIKEQVEEGNIIEPKYFLPIIPTVLLNGSSGIAVGFATYILNRNPDDLIQACLDYLAGKPIKDLLPYYSNTDCTIERDPEEPSRYLISGRYKIINTTTVEITELPPSMTFERFDRHLNNLVEEKKISSYDNNCSKNRINYTIKFSRVQLQHYAKRNTLRNLLKMQERESDNLTTLDENGKLKVFDSPKDIVRYFVDFRLKYFQKRKDYILDQLKKKLTMLSNRARFIKYIIEDKIIIKKTPKAEVIKKLVEYEFDKIEGNYEYLLRMPIHSLTLERFNELLEDVEKAKKELEISKKLVPKEMYREDLNELRIAIK